MRRVRPWLIAGSLLVFLLSYLSVNTDVGSDPKLTLLVSQALLDHRTTYLDAYVADTLIDAPFAQYVAEGVILRTGQHYSHYFPVGPSLVALPAVALARLGEPEVTPGRARPRRPPLLLLRGLLGLRPVPAVERRGRVRGGLARNRPRRRRWSSSRAS